MGLYAKFFLMMVGLALVAAAFVAVWLGGACLLARAAMEMLHADSGVVILMALAPMFGAFVWFYGGVMAATEILAR